MTDTSELFRLMCDTPEIQDGHKWQEGDWYYHPIIKIVHVASADTIKYRYTFFTNTFIFLPDDHWFLDHIEGFIDIIRQTGKMFVVFWGGRHNTKIFDISDSLEISLLQVYMYVEHGKIWEDGKWVVI